MFTTKPCLEVPHSQDFLITPRGGDSITNNDDNVIKIKAITLNSPASDVSFSEQIWTASSMVFFCSLFLILQKLRSKRKKLASISTLYWHPHLFTDSTLSPLKSLISKNFFTKYAMMLLKVLITLGHVGFLIVRSRYMSLVHFCTLES